MHIQRFESPEKFVEWLYGLAKDEDMTVQRFELKKGWETRALYLQNGHGLATGQIIYMPPIFEDFLRVAWKYNHKKLQYAGFKTATALLALLEKRFEIVTDILETIERSN